MKHQLAGLALLLCGLPSWGAAQSLVVLFGQSRPPFVDEKTQSGISVELIDEALRRMNFSAQREFAANKRMDLELHQGYVDVAVEVQPNDKTVFYSTRFIAYRNFAVSRDGKKYPTWGSMQGKSVCAWQGASASLGAEFASASARFAQYREFPEQQRQVHAWLLGLCDIVLIDDTLLREQIRQIQAQVPDLKAPDANLLRFTPLSVAHELWWYVGFRSATIRDQFNRALEQMQQDGTYQKIREKYN